MVHHLLQRSLTEQCPIEIIYLSANNRFTKRKIIVKKFDDKKVLAYCYMRNHVRFFIISQILSAMPVRKIS